MKDDVIRVLDVKARAFLDVLEMVAESAGALVGERTEAGETGPRYTSGEAQLSGVVWELHAGETDDWTTARLDFGDEREERDLVVKWKKITAASGKAGDKRAWHVVASFAWELER